MPKVQKRASKWDKIPKGNYRVVDLGRPAIFLLPAEKLETMVGGITVRDLVHQFLVANFGAYTASYIPSFGLWRSGKGVIHDKCYEFEVSFSGKEKIPVLLEKLAGIAALIKEECIYVKAGQYSGLVFPIKE